MNNAKEPKNVKFVTWFADNDKDFVSDCHLIEAFFDGQKVWDCDHHYSPTEQKEGFLSCLKVLYPNAVISEENRNDPDVDGE